MQFPPSDNTHTNDEDRARGRLRYLMQRAALRATGRASVRALADAIGMNHATLGDCIKNNRCTPGVALKIEDLVGKDHTPNEWLRFPLEVIADGKPD